jgi:NAD-dependent dihydropyrimidine dehydrogenase PreA subunit
MVVEVDSKVCVYCAGCVGLCPVEAIELRETRLAILDSCTDCGICVKFCPVEALSGGRPLA